MNSRTWFVGLALVAIALFIVDESFGRGRGGRGGGGRGGGGMSRGGGGGRSYGGGGRSYGGGGGRQVSRGGYSGGGMNRGGGPRYSSGGRTPSFSGGSRPSMANRPAGGANRPQMANRPGGGSRPNIQPGGRPNISPGTRPVAGGGQRPGIAGGGQRPGVGGGAQLPGMAGGNRPQIGQRPNVGPGAGNRGSLGNLGLAAGAGAAGAAIGNRLGEGGAGTRLPGLDGGAGDRRPGGDRRATSPQDRRQNLQDRMADRGGDRQDRRDDRQGDRGDRRDDRQGNRQDNRDDRQDNRQDNRDDRRDDWRENWENNNWYHDDWAHGHWNDWGEGWWDHMWDEHPYAAAFGLTAWGANSLGYLFGYEDYSNPYYYAEPAAGDVVYDYSQPLVSYASYSEPAAVEEPADPGATAPAATPLPPGVTQEALDAFTRARDTFYKGDYPAALTLVDKVLKEMAKDAATHEFRALVLFALERYPDAASTIYAVLAVGPGWDWTTMSSMYPDVATYTEQLRKLEEFVKANPGSSPGMFLLAYHYITMGHKDAAAKQLRKVVDLTPENQVAKQLLSGLDPSYVPADVQPSRPAANNATPGPSATELVGDWSATSKTGKFEMKLTEDGKFNWIYDHAGKKQEVKGVYAIQGNTLAMEPDSGGTMLADLSMSGKDSMNFLMVGGPPGDPGLKFTR